MLFTRQRFFNWVHIFITNSNKYSFIKSTNIVVVCLLQLKDPCPTLKVTSGKWSGNNRLMLFLWQQGKQLTFDAIFSFYKHSVLFLGGGRGYAESCKINVIP